FLFSTTDLTQYAMRSVAGTDVDYTAKRTRVDLQPLALLASGTSSARGGFDFIDKLLLQQKPQVANSLHLARTLAQGFVSPVPQQGGVGLRIAKSQVSPGADGNSQLLVNFAPRLRDTYYKAWASAPQPTSSPALAGLFVLRASTGLFGAAAPQ